MLYLSHSINIVYVNLRDNKFLNLHVKHKIVLRTYNIKIIKTINLLQF